MEFSDLLLSWYDINRRSLPWRGSKDPYKIWISEIIFQQTRIEQGTGYFLRFIDRFPDLESLAGAGEDEVLRLWQGLGYYSRARNLLHTAQYIRDHFHGRFPEEFNEIISLKGIGDYTASCITSICFGQVHAAVDGNVYRVLSRVYADNQPIDSTVGKARFKKAAQELISRERPGDFNEALMDLGATICKPRSPNCSNCPLMDLCLAYRMNSQQDFPVKLPAPGKSSSVMNFLFIRDNRQIVIHKRDERGIWKGMYEFPMIPGEVEQADLVAECEEQYGLQIGDISEISRVKHILTHAELDIRFYSAKAKTANIPYNKPLTSISEDDIDEYPFPKPIVDFLGKRDLL